MSEIKTISITTSESSITFDAFYPYVWFKNAGENDAYIANYAGIEAGAVDVALVKSGECAMITAQTDTVYAKGAGNTTLEVHAQGFAESPFKRSVKGGESISVTPLSVSVNGTYTAPTGSAYSPVTVDVQEQPWEPLEDGYSNFWFELTDDTLSPWLNFSAKNADAVIDWGDGSGEVALDTLTPTHTYSKAGKYVVKVKGVTGIDTQITNTNDIYMQVLRNVELNTEVTAFVNYGFRYCSKLENVVLNGNFQNTGTSFGYCSNLSGVYINGSVSTISTSCFANCRCLVSMVVPSSVSAIRSSAWANCTGLVSLHIQATEPPDLTSGAIPSGVIIYVPAGTGDTYKAAAGWSAYADHILEEGQTVTRAMQRKFAKEAKAIEETGDEVR